MKNTLRAYPLITIDPYQSIWSFSNTLNKSDTKHWTGEKKVMLGDVVVDGESFRFLGKGDKLIKQVKRVISPMFSIYQFRNEKIELKVNFWSPMLLEDPIIFSRPTPYIDFEVTSLDGKKHDVKVVITMDEAHVYNLKRDARLVGDKLNWKGASVAYLGKRVQPYLETSGDNLRINWGYLFVAGKNTNSLAERIEDKRESLKITLDLTKENKGFVVIAYDDIVSLNYYGDLKPGYWRKKYSSIREAIEASLIDHDELLEKSIKRDREILRLAKKSGGSALQTIVTASYRQSIAAHKCSFDNDGELLFISKENFSNGCAATVDVTYPSIPLYLIYNPELVLGMCRPIMKCATLDFWIYDFAPHDAGRYPFVLGNVYGMMDADDKEKRATNFEIYKPFYFYNKDESVFNLNRQMPVEESGNMLIILYVACKLLGKKDYLEQYMPQLESWVKYLVKFGQDPGNQLCTDDFAGHLAHNANLAIKSIMGIEAFSLIKEYLGDSNARNEYHKLAKEFAANWEKRALRGDHYCLTFDNEEGWSLKYNLIWDKYFGSNLFSKEVSEKELKYYVKKANKYGTPLDSRADYTKSDWLVWATSLTDDMEIRNAMLKPIEKFINTSKTHVPFSDWYFTTSGEKRGFQARSVQGGCFATILMDGRNK